MKRELAGMTYEQVAEWCQARRAEIDDALQSRHITEHMADTLRRWVVEQRAMHLVATCLGLLKGGE